MAVDIARAETDRKLAEMEKHLRSIYKEAADEVSVICSDYMESFADRYLEQYQAYMDGKYTKQQFEAWYAAQIGRGKRWEAVRKNMAEALTNTNRIAADYMNSNMPGIFANNYNYSMYTIELAALNNAGAWINPREKMGEFEMASAWSVLDENTVRRLASEEHDLLPKARIDIPKDQAWNQRKIQNALLQGVLLGDDINSIAGRIAMAAGHMNEVSAIRNARTMVTEAENRGRLQNYKDAEKLGLNLLKEWIATADDRTRESHAELDGVRVPVKDLFPNGLVCPGDHRGDPAEVYNCRCSMRSVFPGFDSEKAHVTGHTVESYKDWLGSKAPADRTSDILFEKRVKQQDAAYFNTKMLKQHTLKESEWSGKLIHESIENMPDEVGRKEWNCDITLREDAGKKTTIHELLHARSISHYHRDYIVDVYLKNKKIEEGAVELFAQEICKKEGYSFAGAYYDETKRLREIRRTFFPGTETYDFAKKLFEVETTKRYNFLKEELERWEKTKKPRREDVSRMKKIVDYFAPLK